MIKFFTILLLGLSAGVAISQKYGTKAPSVRPTPDIKVVRAGEPEEMPLSVRYNFTEYGIKEGMSHIEVTSVFVDSRQLVWTGTYGAGLNVFDGNRIKSYDKKNGVPNDVIWTILEDNSGNIWFASDGGLIKFDGDSFLTVVDTSRLEGDHVVKCLCHGEGTTFWLGTSEKGVFQYDYQTDKIVTHLTPMQMFGGENVLVYDLTLDLENNLWIALNREGIVKYDGENFTLFPPDSSGLGHEIVKDLLCDSQGNIWASTFGGVSLLKEDKFENYTTEDGLVSNYARYGFESRTGDLYFCTLGNGISVYNEELGFYRKYTTEEGLVSHWVSGITEDSNGNLWIASSYEGLVKKENEAFTFYYPDFNETDMYVYDMLETKNGNYWFATQFGIMYYADDKLLRFGEEHGLPQNEILSIAEDSKGNLWIGTASSGACYFDWKTFECYEQNWVNGLSGRQISTMFVDNEDRVWLATNGGVNTIKDRQITWYREENGLSYYLTKDIFQDRRENIWVGTFGGGVSIIPSEKSVTDTAQFIRLMAEQGYLKSNFVPVISEDREGNIWMVNPGHEIVVVKSDWKSINDTADWFVRIDYQDGLINDNVEFMLEDDFGNMWIGTSSGLDKLEKAAVSLESGNYRFTHYGFNEGYKGITSIKHSCLKDSKGYLWFGAGNFITRYNPDIQDNNQPAPSVRITGIKLHFEEPIWEEIEGAHFDGFSEWDFLPVNLSLPYDENHITFEFIGVSHYMSQNVTYQWKLEGFDEEWTPINSEHKATYSGLPSGNFTFKLKCIGGNGKEIITSYEFVVRPPFWQTWWFRIIVVGGFLLIVFGVFQWRTRNLRKRQVILENTVQERTKEVHEQKELLEEQHQEIMDSIAYAQRIQDAILPPTDTIEKHIPDHFIYYRPKDIVAGDFYWFEHQKDLLLLAAADCTGHGVPGAMVSVVCHNALNRAVREFELKDPDKILNKTRELVIETLVQHGKEVKDGMDISLCRFLDRKIVYSGANNPLWIVRKTSLLKDEEKKSKSTVTEGAHSLIEFKADKQPIGLYAGMKDFTLTEILLEEGDVLYLFTDGFADQFGGEKGKKLKYRPFKKILLDLHKLPMSEQKSRLDQIFDEWRGEYEQIDDVCIIGIRV